MIEELRKTSCISRHPRDKDWAVDDNDDGRVAAPTYAVPASTYAWRPARGSLDGPLNEDAQHIIMMLTYDSYHGMLVGS